MRLRRRRLPCCGCRSRALTHKYRSRGLRSRRESSDFFVRQHYVDFLNRAPDASGFAFWQNNINSCASAGCRDARRIDTSAAFFLSIEFQQTGFIVEKTYQAAFNRVPAFREFNRAFVLMEYFGYLRRDPDSSGFQFWLAKLNSFGGDFRRAEMVKAFITSTEYRQRFGQP